MPETTCVVPFCSRKGRHKFPKDKAQRDAWVHAIKRGKSKFEMWSPTKYCENHFTGDDYHSETYSGVERQKKALRKTAVPSVFSWTCQDTLQKKRARKDRCLYRDARKRKLFHDISNISEEPQPEFIAQKLEIVSDDLDVGAVEEVIPMDTETVCEVETDVQGIPSYVYAVVQTPKQPAFSIHTTSFELSRMFSVAESVISNIFITWVLFMEKQWRELNIWPSKELVKHFAPSSLKKTTQTHVL